jgi:transcription antitermination factor NusG
LIGADTRIGSDYSGFTSVVVFSRKSNMHTDFGFNSISSGVRLESYPQPFPWYGVRTRSNHEKVAASVLRGKGYEPYLPLYSLRRSRANVVTESELPLFPGYVFCRFDVTKRLPILMTTGVISILGFGRDPVPIPEEEIEAVRAVLRSGLPSEPCAYLREGQRVRVTNGPLAGVEGVLLKRKNQCRMVVSVTMLQRSLSVEIDGHRLAAL